MGTWDATLYDRKHQFVSQYGERVLDILNPKKNETILDLGCGTGDLSNVLFEMGVHVIGIDNSENMVREAKEKYPDISFFSRDILDLQFDNKFDAVFSNAVLHWVKSPELALQQIFQSLQNEGRFVAEFGGEQNVEQITAQIIVERQRLGYSRAAIDFPWYFPSIGEYTSLMEKVGFQVVYAEHVDRPTPLDGKDGLRNWLLMFSHNFFSDVTESDKVTLLDNIETSLRETMFNDGLWIADYKRIRVKGVKRIKEVI